MYEQLAAVGDANAGGICLYMCKAISNGEYKSRKKSCAQTEDPNPVDKTPTPSKLTRSTKRRKKNERKITENKRWEASPGRLPTQVQIMICGANGALPSCVLSHQAQDGPNAKCPASQDGTGDKKVPAVSQAHG